MPCLILVSLWPKKYSVKNKTTQIESSELAKNVSFKEVNLNKKMYNLYCLNKYFHTIYYFLLNTKKPFSKTPGHPK